MATDVTGTVDGVTNTSGTCPLLVTRGVDEAEGSGEH